MPGFAADDACDGCHRNPDFFAQYRKLYDYYERWRGSPHEAAGVGCSDCHGGNPNAESADGAHQGVLSMSDARSTLHNQAQPDTCGQCHRANRRQFVESKHFESLMTDGSAPTCTTCHPAMSSRPELRRIVADACSNCHSPGNEANLPLVSDLAAQVFQQLNAAGGLLGWTRVHYESLGWPEDSRNRVATLENRHEDIISQVHAFRLEDIEAATTDLMGELRAIFDAARQAHEERSENPL